MRKIITIFLLLFTIYFVKAQTFILDTSINVGSFHSNPIDINNDGYFDFISRDSSLLILNNAGIFVKTNHSFIDTSNYYSFGQIKWFDFDNNGNYDIYVNPPKLYSNYGINNFAELTSVNFQNSWGGREISYGDYNKDGYLDIINNCFDCNTEEGELGGQLFFNQGFGDFSVINTVPALSGNWFGYRPITNFDYNNDGNVDIINGSALYNNDGSGTFTYTGTYFPSSLTFIGDYDKDGDFDLLIDRTHDDCGNISGIGTIYRNDQQFRYKFFLVTPQKG